VVVGALIMEPAHRSPAPPARPPALDETDRRICALVQQDARRSTPGIGKEVGLSAPAVAERVRRLEAAGVIRGYHARLDPEQLGYGLSVLLAVGISSHAASAVAAFTEAVAAIPEILECHHTTGRADFILKVVARDVQHYKAVLLTQVASLPGVHRVESSVVLTTYKDTDDVPL
jgi:Lrp/AsnC family transcriptional regulator, leucine-responsive regulatory protein